MREVVGRGRQQAWEMGAFLGPPPLPRGSEASAWSKARASLAHGWRGMGSHPPSHPRQH